MKRSLLIVVTLIVMVGVMTYILRIPANTRAYMDVVRHESEDKLNVIEFVYNYGYQSPSPIADSAYWGLWMFNDDESSGTILDLSGNNRDLDNQNPNCATEYSPGLIGSICLEVEGLVSPGCQYSYHDITGLTGQNPESTAWTFWLWYKADNNGNEGADCLEVYFPPDCVFDIYNLTTTPNEADLYFYSYIGNNPEWDTFGSPLAWSWDQWCLYMFTFDGDKVRAYINNVLKWTSGSVSPSGNTTWDDVVMTGGWYDSKGWQEQMGLLKGVAADDTVRAYIYNSGAGRSLP